MIDIFLGSQRINSIFDFYYDLVKKHVITNNFADFNTPRLIQNFSFLLTCIHIYKNLDNIYYTISNDNPDDLNVNPDELLIDSQNYNADLFTEDIKTLLLTNHRYIINASEIEPIDICKLFANELWNKISSREKDFTIIKSTELDNGAIGKYYSEGTSVKVGIKLRQSYKLLKKQLNINLTYDELKDALVKNNYIKLNSGKNDKVHFKVGSDMRGVELVGDYPKEVLN